MTIDTFSTFVFAYTYDLLKTDPEARASVITLMFIAVSAFLLIVTRKRKFSADFELNAIYHNPPAGAKTTIRPCESIELSVPEIQRTMQLAQIYAKPDYELAKDPKKYEEILNRNRTNLSQ